MKKIFLLILSVFSFISTISAQKPLILSKNSKISIVIPDSATEIQINSANELNNYLRYILDNNAKIVKSSNHKGGKAIFIGKSSKNFKIYEQYCDSIKDDGFLLHTEKGNFYIFGNSSKSELYGVYHLLENYFKAICLIPDEIVFPKNLEKVALPLHDLQNPSFSYREALALFPNASQEYADWHKLHNRNDLNREWGMFVHTFEKLIPANAYFETNPEWFSQIKGIRVKDGQLCLTNDEVFEELCENLEPLIKAFPEKKFWSVSQNDNENSCTCPNCLHSDSLYGGKSGTMLKFVNKVAERFPDKTISMLAYLQTRRPPKNIVPRENVNIMFCSIECQRQIPISENPAEQQFVKDLKGWTDLTHNVFLWDYVVQFKHFFNPFPNLHILQPNLQLFKKYGVPMIFEQGCSDLCTENAEWRTFLLSHLMWNVNINIDSLRNVFLTHYYGKNRAPFVAHYLDKMTEELKKSGQVLNIYGFPIDAIDGYLSPENIEYYYTLFDSALKTQPFDYEVKGDNLETYNYRLERLKFALDFAVLDLSAQDVTPELSFVNENSTENSEMRGKLNNFIMDCRRFEARHLNESGYTYSDFYSNIIHLIDKKVETNLAANKRVTCKTSWSELYNPGAPHCLTDGVVGNTDYRKNWLGFQQEDFDAIIDLDSIQEIREICADFYFYPLSWIFAPEYAQFFISEDGNTWKDLGKVYHQNEEKLTKTKIVTLGMNSLNEKGRYVRIFAKSLLTNPEWHRGYGQPCWLFVDELFVR